MPAAEMISMHGKTAFKKHGMWADAAELRQ
jgi:hypothetical protein